MVWAQRFASLRTAVVRLMSCPGINNGVYCKFNDLVEELLNGTELISSERPIDFNVSMLAAAFKNLGGNDSSGVARVKFTVPFNDLHIEDKVDMTTIPTSINDIIMHMCRDDTSAVDVNDYLFNSEGVETNEILFDPSGGSNCLEVSGGESRRMNSSNRTARIFACRGGDGGGDLTTMAKATSDVYILLPTARTVNDDFHDQVVVWKFGTEYNIATINIGSIPTLGSSSSSSSSKVYIPTIQRTDR